MYVYLNVHIMMDYHSHDGTIACRFRSPCLADESLSRRQAGAAWSSLPSPG